MKSRRAPTKITLDACVASHCGMKETGELPRRVKVRSSQYLNKLVEQDHWRVKQRIRRMLGFKRFDHAAVTISGIELVVKIKKGQFKTGEFGIGTGLCWNCGKRRLLLDHLASTTPWRAYRRMRTELAVPVAFVTNHSESDRACRRGVVRRSSPLLSS